MVMTVISINVAKKGGWRFYLKKKKKNTKKKKTNARKITGIQINNSYF